MIAPIVLACVYMQHVTLILRASLHCELWETLESTLVMLEKRLPPGWSLPPGPREIAPLGPESDGGSPPVGWTHVSAWR